MREVKLMIHYGFHLGKEWLRQKLPRFTYKNSDIPALKYGKERDAHVAEMFKKVISDK